MFDLPGCDYLYEQLNVEKPDNYEQLKGEMEEKKKVNNRSHRSYSHRTGLPFFRKSPDRDGASRLVMNDLYRDATDEDVASAFIFDNKALQRALKHIYEKDFQPMTEIEESLFNETFRIFTEATDEGISESGTEPPVEFRQKIDWGNAVFSAFKVHRMQNDIATRLFDSNGDLNRSNQWRNDVHPMLDHHVKTLAADRI